MEDKIVITGEFKGSKQHFRIVEKNKKSKIDCVGLILKTFKRKEFQKNNWTFFINRNKKSK
jgi:hypothetical protein